MNVFNKIILMGVISFGVIWISNAYAEELSYDDKFEFALKIQEITGHMVSALGNIVEKEYTLAKMHLIHPLAEHSDIVDFLSKDSICHQKLSLVLRMIQATDPEFDRKIIDQRFSYIFQVLNECNAVVVGTDVESNFTIELIDKLLDESISEYKESTHVNGMGQIMESQDALSLLIRAHMLIDSSRIFDTQQIDTIHNNFKKLFLSHFNEESVTEITILTNQLRNKIGLNDIIIDNSTMNDKSFPNVYLKSVYYSNDLNILELRGKNFDVNKKIIIEYFSPITKKIENINGISTSKGELYIPFALVDNSFDESIMFSITTNNDIVLYELLSLS